MARAKRSIKQPRRARAPKRESETRERLLESALELFAERGFDAVTVRDLSQHARANLAAVSYHFGDKLGLYKELLDGAIRGMRSFQEKHRTESEKLEPDDQLRHYVRTYLPLMASAHSRHVTQLQKLTRLEIVKPSPLGRRVIEQGVLPRFQYLSGIVAKLLDTKLDDPRVRSCALSIQAQCVIYARDPMHANLPKEWTLESETAIANAAEHVAEFSLAGIRAIKRSER